MVIYRNNQQRRDKRKGDRTGTSRCHLAPERSLIARLLPLSQSPTSLDSLSLHATPPTPNIPRCQPASRTNRHAMPRPLHALCVAVAFVVSPLSAHCVRSSTGWSAVRNARHAMCLFLLFLVPLRDIRLCSLPTIGESSPPLGMMTGDPKKQRASFLQPGTGLHGRLPSLLATSQVRGCSSC